MSTLPRNFRKLFFRTALVAAFREYFNRRVNRFKAGKRLKLHNKCAIFKEGRKGSKYLDISVEKPVSENFSSFLKIIDRKTNLVGYSFFDTFDEFR